jgi:OPT oligopeptide transporter protein
MASAAANAPLAIEVLATQKLYYDKRPNPFISMLLIFSSQCLGYGIAGLLRQTLVYPTKMLFPSNLPINTLLETLHGKNKGTVRKRLQLFYIGFVCLFVWETLPQYISVSPFLFRTTLNADEFQCPS